MQPYQKESERSRKSGENVLGALKYAAGTAIGGGLATAGSKYSKGILDKIGAFLSPYLSENISMNGLKKIDSRVGAFAEKAIANGADFEEVREFIGDKIKTSENENIVQQHSPELHEFIKEQLNRGRSPLEAGAIAQNDKRFSDAISKLTKAHKSPWSAILQTVYGGQQPQQQNQGATESAAPQQPEQQPQQSGQPGQGQQDLMDILQKIQQTRGGGGQ